MQVNMCELEGPDILQLLQCLWNTIKQTLIKKECDSAETSTIDPATGDVSLLLPHMAYSGIWRGCQAGLTPLQEQTQK